MLCSVHVDMIVRFVLVGSVLSGEQGQTGVFVVGVQSAVLHVAASGVLGSEGLYKSGMWMSVCHAIYILYIHPGKKLKT